MSATYLEHSSCGDVGVSSALIQIYRMRLHKSRPWPILLLQIVDTQQT